MNDPTPLEVALTSFGTVWSQVVTMITGNEYLMIFLAAGLIGTAFRIFKRAKKSVR